LGLERVNDEQKTARLIAKCLRFLLSFLLSSKLNTLRQPQQCTTVTATVSHSLLPLTVLPALTVALHYDNALATQTATTASSAFEKASAICSPFFWLVSARRSAQYMLFFHYQHHNKMSL
jgi:hypothetical protein